MGRPHHRGILWASKCNLSNYTCCYGCDSSRSCLRRYCFCFLRKTRRREPSSSNQSVTLNGAGSTLVYPLMSAWTYNYTVLNPNIRVNYASVGSGAGISQIESKIVDFGASDAPLSLVQYTALTAGHAGTKNVLQIPEVAGAIVPAYNIPNNATGLPLIGNGLNFTQRFLRIYLGKITKWNDPALQQLNPGARAPESNNFRRAQTDGSGTTFVWTDYLSQVSTEWAN